MAEGESSSERQQNRLKVAAAAVAFAIGFIILVVLMLPNPWALAAGAAVGLAAGAGTYGTMSGRQITRKMRAEELNATQSQLQGQLEELDAVVRTRSHQFPPSAHGQLRMIVVGLTEIVQRWETLDRAPDQQDAVHATITRHLPRTLELFSALPDADKVEHAAEFKSQVNLLADAVARTRDRVVAKDLQALRNNGWLLEESLTDPDERLFRDQGL